VDGSPAPKVPFMGGSRSASTRGWIVRPKPVLVDTLYGACSTVAAGWSPRSFHIRPTTAPI